MLACAAGMQERQEMSLLLILSKVVSWWLNLANGFGCELIKTQSVRYIRRCSIPVLACWHVQQETRDVSISKVVS